LFYKNSETKGIAAGADFSFCMEFHTVGKGRKIGTIVNHIHIRKLADMYGIPFMT